METSGLLRQLIQQFMIGRRDPRVAVELPVQLTGTDRNDRPLDQQVTAINISRRGALLKNVHGMLRPGIKISLARLNKQESFQVAWIGEENTPEAGQVGVSAVDPNSSFWNDVLDKMTPSAGEKQKARAASA